MASTPLACQKHLGVAKCGNQPWLLRLGAVLWGQEEEATPTAFQTGGGAGAGSWLAQRPRLDKGEICTIHFPGLIVCLTQPLCPFRNIYVYIYVFLMLFTGGSFYLCPCQTCVIWILNMCVLPSSNPLQKAKPCRKFLPG